MHWWLISRDDVALLCSLHCYHSTHLAAAFTDKVNRDYHVAAAATSPTPPYCDNIDTPMQTDSQAVDKSITLDLLRLSTGYRSPQMESPDEPISVDNSLHNKSPHSQSADSTSYVTDTSILTAIFQLNLGVI